ncbi:MAG: MMPL family transporter [Actinomycetota bacterium]|nr:MMPL family transporter [Actinomycetota bacterium]
MSPPIRSNNIAARMGRWSARHRKLAVFSWLAFVIAAFVIGGAIGTKELKPEDQGVGESGRADKILAEDFETPPGERILVQHPTLTVGDRQFDGVVADVVERVSARPELTNVRSPLQEENSGFVSRDRHSALVTFEFRSTDEKQAEQQIDSILAAVAGAERAHPGFTVEEFGDASVAKQLTDRFAEDLKKAGLFSVPLTLAILLLAFGALVAAGIPVLLGLTAVFGATGLFAVASQWVGSSDGVDALMLLIGLAVGVDYSMFYLKREREERARGRSEEAALEAAAATSGRAVLVSGFTVMIAMAGLFMMGQASFYGFAIATMLVVGVAMLGSITVLPAVLSKLGDRVNKARVPLVHRLRRSDGESRFWNAVLDRVLRRPLAAAVAAGALLVGLSAFALQMHTVQASPDAFPKSLPVMQTYDKMQKAFPGGEIPATVVVRADDVTSPAMQEAVGQLRWRAVDTGVMREPIRVDVNPDKTVALISVPVLGDGTDSTSNEALRALREEVVPPSFGRVEGVEYAVGGYTAASKDFNDLMSAKAPWVFGFVLILAFLLLLVTFRSIVIPVKAIVLNLLSVSAAYGVLVIVFQHGVGKGILDFDFTGGIDSFLPVFLFVILFGLSMDYHVFILSRVREAFDSGMKTEDAVAHGIKATASVVTSAAIVMVGVFAIFGTLSLLFLKQFGVGLAAAILIDATIVRAVLLPATMKLLGDWNWYLPRWLEWLPRLEHEQAPAGPAVVPAGR